MNKEQLFRRFASNLRETFNRNSITINAEGFTIPLELYLCPISLSLHSIDSIEEGKLTTEHVPPKSLGGRGLVLTDKRINNNDGHTADKDLLLFFQTKNFIAHGGQLDARISAKSLSMKGISTKFSLQTEKVLENDKIKVEFITSAQNIKAMDYKGVFNSWNGLPFTVSVPMSTKLNRKTILKCAYLTAFSRLGYVLLFDKTGFKNSTYGVLISALNNQDNDFPLIVFDYHAPLENSDVGVIGEPKEYRSLFVNLTFKLEGQVYKYVIFLPHPDEENLDCLKRIKNIPAGQTVNFNISEIVGKI